MSDSQSLICQQAPIEDGLLIYLQGEIEFSHSPQLRSELVGLLDQQRPERLIIDLAGVPYMDSSGVATLVEVLQRQRNRGYKLVLHSLQSKVYSMFEIASLDRLFTIAEDLDTAKRV